MGTSVSEPNSEVRVKLFREFARCGPRISKLGEPLVSIRQVIDGGRSFKLNLQHVPLLYQIDSDKDGLVSLTDIMNLSGFLLQIDERDALKSLKANSTLLLNKQHDQFVRWFGASVVQIDGQEIIDGVPSVRRQVMSVVYELFNAKITRVSLDEFVETLQISAQQLGLKVSEDYVPIVVIQTLAQHVVTGIQELYKEIVDGVQPIKLVRRF